MCYSDISALYGARQINTDQWPYASADNSLEYPVLTGVVTYLTGLLIDDPNGYRAYFDVNAFLIVLLLFASVFILWRLAPKYTPLFPIAPSDAAAWCSTADLEGAMKDLKEFCTKALKKYLITTPAPKDKP